MAMNLLSRLYHLLELARAALTWQRVTDFVALSAALYALLALARKTRAVRLVIAIITVYLLSLASRRFELLITSWLLESAAFLFGATLLIAFQPELRRAILGVDNLLRVRRSARSHAEAEAISRAAFEMASQQLGALIMIVRRDPVEEIFTHWMPFGSPVSAEILLAIFQHSSPLHDGAAIVDGARIVAVKAILPLSSRRDLAPQLGTRHRAAMGASERSDAVIVVVSEQRQEVHVVERAQMHPVTDRQQLVAELEGRLGRNRTVSGGRLKVLVTDNLSFKIAATAMSALICGAAFLLPASTVRSISVPIEFNNLPSGLEISDISANHVDVELQGRSMLLSGVNRADLAAHIDLRNAKAGTESVPITAGSLRLSPGIVADQISPDIITVHLRSAKHRLK
jgi:diadenylate cyclase